MSGHLVTGVGPALVMYGYLGVGSCRRGKPPFGCRGTGCAEREVGYGSRATGSRPTLGYVSAIDSEERTRRKVIFCETPRQASQQSIEVLPKSATTR
jgi:hypothetical protein